jgi:hypothetical protein
MGVRSRHPPVQSADTKARMDAIDRDRQAPFPVVVHGALGRAIEQIRLDRFRSPQIGDPQADQAHGLALPAAGLVQRPSSMRGRR